MKGWEQKGGDSRANGGDWGLPCAAGLARKRFSARAEGEALSQSRRRFPRSGIAGARFRRGRAAAGDFCERERDRMAETTGSVTPAKAGGVAPGPQSGTGCGFATDC